MPFIPPTSGSGNVAANVGQVANSLKSASVFTAKMAADMHTLSKLSLAIGKDSFIGAIANIVSPGSNLSSGINKLVEIASKGAPDFTALQKRINESTVSRAYAEAGLAASLTGSPQEKGAIIDEAKAINDIADETERVMMLNTQIVSLHDKSAQDAHRVFIDSLQTVKALEDQRAELQKQGAIYSELQKLHSTEQILRSAIVGTGLLMAIKLSGEYNAALIEANSSLATRYSIVTDTLRAQVATGASTQEATGLLRAMTQEAFKTKADFHGILDDALMLNDALGLSESDVAKLARSAYLLGRTFRGVADEMASILNNTRLTAAEAKGMIETLSKAYLVLGGSGSGVMELIAGVEGELKKRTGVSGELTAMLGNMASTAQGAQMAGQMFGVSTRDLGTKAGVERMIEMLAQRVQTDTRGKDHIGKLQALENISQSWTGGAVSVNTLFRLSEALKETNSVTAKKISIEERWREQMTDTLRAIERLKGSFQALVQSGFSPILLVVKHIISWTADLVGLIGKIPGAASVFTVAVGGALVIAVGRATWNIINLTRSLWGLAIAAGGASAATKAGIFGELFNLGKARGQLFGEIAALWKGKSVGGLGSASRGIRVAFATRNFARLGGLIRSLFVHGLAVFASPAFLARVVAPIGAFMAGWEIGQVINRWIDKRKMDSDRKEWNRIYMDADEPRLRFQALRAEAIRSGEAGRIVDLFQQNRQLLLNAHIIGQMIKGPDGKYAWQDRGRLDDAKVALYQQRAINSMVTGMATRSIVSSDETAAKAVANEIAQKQIPLLKSSEQQLEIMRAELQERRVRERQEDQRRDREREEEQLRGLYEKYDHVPLGPKF